jgi:hypothetical protein
MRDIDYPRRGSVNSERLDIGRADSTLRDAATLWVGDFLDVYENGVKLPYPTVAAARASVQSDPSFASYDAALAHALGPRLPDDAEFVWSQGLLDILFEFRIQSDRSQFSMDPRFARLGIRTLTVVRFMPPSGDVRSFELDGERGVVQLTRARSGGAPVRRDGLRRLWDGVDELLLVLCLVLPFRRLGQVRAIAGSFAIGFSVTLMASFWGLAPDALWFRPLVATLAAASILYTSLENIVAVDLNRRRMCAFGFGLLYGFSFAFDWKQNLQFAGGHSIAAVLTFDGGLLVGQFLVTALMAAAAAAIFTFVVAERTGTVIVSALVVHSAWHWTVDRGDILRRFRFEWPALDLAFWASVMRWAMLMVLAFGLYWLVFSVLQRPADTIGSARKEGF